MCHWLKYIIISTLFCQQKLIDLNTEAAATSLLDKVNNVDNVEGYQRYFKLEQCKVSRLTTPY